MKNFFLFLSISFLLTSCHSKIDIVKIEKCQLRSTTKNDINQFNFDMIIQFSRMNQVIEYSEIDVKVNGVYLGKSIIAAETEPLNTERYVMPLRVTFPANKLVITDENTVEIDGFLNINNQQRNIQFVQNGLSVNNMTSQ
jgi:predicted nucleotidyltransferase